MIKKRNKQPQKVYGWVEKQNVLPISITTKGNNILLDILCHSERSEESVER